MSTSGSTTVRYTDCGTFEVPNAIRSVSSCMFTPNPVVGQVDGSAFELPTSGFLGSEATWSRAFYPPAAATPMTARHCFRIDRRSPSRGTALAIC